jgi:hypothetical protein
MEKKFKITLPEIKINEEDKEKSVKKAFTDDFEKKGILAKVFIFIYLNEVSPITELTKSLRDYYKTEFEKTYVFRAVSKLLNLDLINKVQVGYVLALPNSEKKEVHKNIVQKHFQFLNKIPEPFRQRFNDVNYYWIREKKYLEWCCKLLGFKISEEKEEK